MIILPISLMGFDVAGEMVAEEGSEEVDTSTDEVGLTCTNVGAEIREQESKNPATSIVTMAN
jgi:hypothetical protein